MLTTLSKRRYNPLFSMYKLCNTLLVHVFSRHSYLYLFICHTITIITKKCQKKCRKKWRGGLKETIELMLIRPPNYSFFEDGIKLDNRWMRQKKWVFFFCGNLDTLSNYSAAENLPLISQIEKKPIIPDILSDVFT